MMNTQFFPNSCQRAKTLKNGISSRLALLVLLSGMFLFSHAESQAQNTVPLCTTGLQMTGVGASGVDCMPACTWSWSGAGLSISCPTCQFTDISAPSAGTYTAVLSFSGSNQPPASITYSLSFGAVDADMDGFLNCHDCDDNNPALNPNTVWYQDADNDGYSNGSTLTQCEQTTGYKLATNLLSTFGDCNDGIAAVNPDAAETCNGIDDNCNGNTDEGNVCGTPSSILYVKANAGGANNGASWADAYNSLQDALANAAQNANITEVWVAAGVYKPTAGTDRNASFVMKNNLAIYGGFPNTGDPGMTGRDWAVNVTTLSGDIGTAGDNSDNSFSVIKNITTSLDNTAVLDGFTITGGNGGSGSGGGMRNLLSSPAVRNCLFSGNTANFGGGMYNEGGTPALSNCAFIGNSASQGGGMYIIASSPTVVNCTFSGNTAAGGGGLYMTTVANIPTSPVLTNCIVWGNSSGIANSVTPAITH